MDEPLPGATGDTPLPRSLPSGDTLPHLETQGGRGAPIVIEPRKPPKDDRMQVSTAWEVVPMPKPPSTSHGPRSERSASSVVARSVPAGGRAFVMRPAVLAALVVLLALTVSLIVILMRPTGGGGGAPRPAESSFFADDGPVLPATPDASSGTLPVTGPVPTPPTTDASTVAPPVADASAPPAELSSRIVLLGLPAGATADLAGLPFVGWPPEIMVPRTASPSLLRVIAPGFRTYETSVRPTGDMQISVPLERMDDAGTASVPDAGGTTNHPPTTPRWPPRRPPPTNQYPTYQPPVQYPVTPPPPRDAGGRPNNGLPLPENAPW
jgi:hypothetical protein